MATAFHRRCAYGSSKTGTQVTILRCKPPLGTLANVHYISLLFFILVGKDKNCSVNFKKSRGFCKAVGLVGVWWGPSASLQSKNCYTPTQGPK